MSPSRRAVVWFPHNPWPPLTGAHRRCLTLLSSLRELGWATTLLSSTLAHEPWTPASIAELTRATVTDVRVYPHTARDRQLHRVWWRWERLRRRVGSPGLDSWAVVPPSQRVWSRRQIESIGPDLMLSSYAQYDPLVPHADFPDAQSIIDSIDIVGASQAMWHRPAPKLSAPGPSAGHVLATADVESEVLTPGFLDEASRRVLPRELRLYDRYSDTLAISTSEAGSIARETTRTAVHYVPMTASAEELTNSHEGPALFVGAPNPFNLQGLLWFAKCALPTVRASTRPTTLLDVVGQTFVPWQADDGIALHGQLPDLDPLYERAAFAICPLLAGTGQQVKIVEAMAHGVPVLATPMSGAASLIVDGTNGYIADGPEAFAARFLELWHDRTLCRAMGQAARATIESEFSPSRTTAELDAILR